MPIPALVDQSFCIRTKYEQSSANALSFLIAHTMFHADRLRLDHVDLYYYDGGIDPGSVVLGLPGADFAGGSSCGDGSFGSAGGERGEPSPDGIQEPSEVFCDAVFLVDEELATSFPQASLVPATSTTGDFWVEETCFTVVDSGQSRIAPYFQTKTAGDQTGTWKTDSGFGLSFLVGAPAIDVLKTCDTEVTEVLPGVATTLVHDISVCNDAEAGDAVNVDVIDTLPTDDDVVYDATLTDDGVLTSPDPARDGDTDGPVYDATNDTVTWHGDLLKAGECADFQLALTVTADQSDVGGTVDTNVGVEVVFDLSESAGDGCIVGETCPEDLEACPIDVLNPTLNVDKSYTGVFTDHDEDGVGSPGDVLQYSVTITNTGTATLTGVTLVDDYDQAYVASVGSISDNGVDDGDTISWDIDTVDAGDFEPGDFVTVTYEATLASAASDTFPQGTTTVENTATGDSDQTGPDSDGAAVDVGAAVSLVVDKRVVDCIDGSEILDPAFAPGDTVCFQVDYENAGNATAHTVALTDDVDDALEMDGLIDAVQQISDAGSYDGDLIAWTLPDLAPGDSGFVTYEVVFADVFPTGTTIADNLAVLTSDEDEVSDDASIDVGAAPALAVSNTVAQTTVVESSVTNSATATSKSDDGLVTIDTDTDTVGPTSVTTATDIEYLVEVTNNGDADAPNVVLSDTFPAGTCFIDATTPNTVTATQVTWDLGTVEVGETESRSLTLRVGGACP